MWWIVFTIFIQYQGRPPFIEFADAVKSMLMNYEIYSFKNSFKWRNGKEGENKRGKKIEKGEEEKQKTECPEHGKIRDSALRA